MKQSVCSFSGVAGHFLFQMGCGHQLLMPVKDAPFDKMEGTKLEIECKQCKTGKIMKVVDLPCYDMVFHVEDGEDGAVASCWHTALERDTCPHCDNPNCNFECDESQVAFDDTSNPDAMEQEVVDRHKVNFALDVVESYTTALVASLEKGGWDTNEAAVKNMIAEAVETTVDAISNQA